MKVLLINGSPHASGCTYRALSEVASTLHQEGIETEMIHIGHLQIHGCIACYKCKETGKCVFNDCVNQIAAKLEQTDGIVVGSPVYYAGMAGTLKSFLDRLFCSAPYSMRFKVGAAVVSARRAGTVATFDDINRFFTISQMIVVCSQYWNEVHGAQAGDVEQDKEGLQTMRVLGRNLSFVIRSLHLGKSQLQLPEEEPWQKTNFIR